MTIPEVKESREEIIRVVFERPTEQGFDTLIFELLSNKIVENDEPIHVHKKFSLPKVVEQ